MEQQFREPDPIKNNLFAQLVPASKDGQTQQRIELQRLSDFTITAKRRRVAKECANEPRVRRTQKPSSHVSTIGVNDSQGISHVDGPMKTSIQHHLHHFSEAIEW